MQLKQETYMEIDGEDVVVPFTSLMETLKKDPKLAKEYHDGHSQGYYGENEWDTHLNDMYDIGKLIGYANTLETQAKNILKTVTHLKREAELIYKLNYENSAG